MRISRRHVRLSVVLAASLALLTPVGADAAGDYRITSGSDPTGDVPDARGDVTSFAVSRSNGIIEASVNVASPTDPGTTSNWEGFTGPTFWLETSGDGMADFAADVYWDGGALRVDVSRNAVHSTLCTGSASVAGSGYKAVFPASCIESPASLRAKVTMYWDTDPDDPDADVYDDSAPELSWSALWSDPGGSTASPPPPSGPRSGYWMLGAKGAVYAFGDARRFSAAPVGSFEAVDIEPTATYDGLWVVTDRGHVLTLGDAAWFGNAPALAAGESVTSLSATLGGRGYWIFTSAGRVLAFGDAVHRGDMAGQRLNGPVLDSVRTASGKGYYMVASDGGIFAFGDARFSGSMGGQRLNAPVQSLVADRDNDGYWLVASDGGVFAFNAPFRGSMGSARLNQPVVGMVRYGNGYLMVASDGGIFNFSDKAFAGSLGGGPPTTPITAVAALDER